MFLSDTSIRRPVLASMMSVALVLFGVLGYRELAVREFPLVEPPIVNVTTTLRGANPRVMESAVTDVLEEELATLEGLRTMISSSAEQRSSITLEFVLGRDIEAATQDVRDKVARVRGRLPEEVDEPVVAKQDPDARPILFLSLGSDTYDLMQLTELAEVVAKTRLQTIPGVGRVDVRGERRYAMRVWLSASELASRGLTVQDVLGAIRSRSVEVPAGRIESDYREFTVRSLGELRTPEEFADLVVSTVGGQPVRLRDVGTVELGPEDDRSVFRFNGRPSVGLSIQGHAQANILEISDAVRAVIPELQSLLPEGVHLEQGYDQSIYIKRSIQEAKETLLIAAGLVVLIIFVFLRNPRATIIPGFAIPASIIGAFALLAAFGFTINNLTLLALTLAIGIVVDDAIIVLENAYRHQEELGESPEVAARNGTREIGFAVIATTISLVAVFTPLAFLKGATGRLFNEFGLAVAGSVVISAFVALTLTPMLCSRMLRVPREHGKVFRALERGFMALAGAYRGGLAWALRHRLAVLGGFGIVTVLAAFTFTRLKREFVPPEDRGGFQVTVTAPEGSTLAYTDHYQRQVERLLLDTPEIESFNSILAMGGRVNSGMLFTRLQDWSLRDRTAMEIIEDLRPKLAQIPGVVAFANNPPAFGGRGQPVQFVVKHPDFDALAAGMDALVSRARHIPGLINVDSDLRVNKPELTVSFDRNRAEDLGVPVRDVATTLQALLGGQRAGTFTRNNKLYDVIVQLRPEARAAPSDMAGIQVRGRGGLVQLDALARVEEGAGPRQLNHYDRVRASTLSAALAPGFTLGEALDSLYAAAAEVLPAGHAIALAGESREFRESGQALYFTFVLALIVVFMVLASQFESLVHPFTVLLAVPLAVSGALFTLYALGSTLNLYSQIGMVLLIGLVAKNSILLVEYANQLRARGLHPLEAVLESGRIRFRPILMTSVATIMGAMPIALGLGAGSLSRRPLGYAIVGGVFFSTALTLFLVPVVYVLLDRARAWLRRPRRAAEVAPAAASAGAGGGDRVIRAALAAGALAAGAAAAACSGSAPADARATARQPPRPIPVEVAAARADSVVDAILATGQIEAVQSIELRPEVEGRLVEILVREGALVRQGQPLFKVDEAELRAQVARVAAERDLALQALERVRLLLADRAAAPADLERAEAQARGAQAQLDLLQLRLDRTTVRAPFSGVVGARLVSLGDYVNSNTRLITLQTVDPQRASFQVPERYADRLRAGQQVRFRVAALPGRDFEGTVDFVDPQVQLPGRTILVKATVPNPRRELQSGMFIEARLATEIRPTAIVAPEEAVVQVAGGSYVWVVAENRATRRAVDLGVRTQGFVEIRRGLDAGELVVVGGVERMVEGVAVNPTVVERGPGAVAPREIRSPTDTGL